MSYRNPKVPPTYEKWVENENGENINDDDDDEAAWLTLTRRGGAEEAEDDGESSDRQTTHGGGGGGDCCVVITHGVFCGSRAADGSSYRRAMASGERKWGLT